MDHQRAPLTRRPPPARPPCIAWGFAVILGTMKTKRRGRYASWRALLAALALLCGALAAPAALAGSSTADVCTMACCVEKGHCCCKPHHAYVEGQTADSNPRVAEAEIAAPCPEGCAAPSTFSPFFKRQSPGPVEHRIDLAAASLIYWSPQISKSSVTASIAAAPRAPPAVHAYLAN
jgi:hypothetical protein